MTDVLPRRGPVLAWSWALAAALLLQMYVLYAPSPGGPTMFSGSDKIVHAGIFAMPVLLAFRVGRRWPWAALACAIHAPVSEVIQGAALPRRSADPWDAVADLTGVALAVAVALVVRRRVRR